MYMAIHVADPEVTQLLNTYVGQTGMTKTEALRRLLKTAVSEEARKLQKKNFRAVALEIMAEARQAGKAAPTKDEIDALYKGTGE